MSFLIASTYLMSSVSGFVSSKRRLRAVNSFAMPKFRLIAWRDRYAESRSAQAKRVLIGRQNGRWRRLPHGLTNEVLGF
jgi:hypothetical protein